MLRYPLRLKLGAASVLVFFMAAVVVAGMVVWRQEGLAASVGGDATWGAYKLDREAIQLRDQLNDAESLGALRVKFELLYSRLNFLQRGEISELFSRIDDQDRLIPAIATQMNILDLQFGGLERLDQASRRSLQIALDPLIYLSQQLVVATNAYLADAKQQEREALQLLHWVLLAMLGLMSLSILMVTRFLFREARENAASRRDQEVLRSRLEEAAQKAQSANEAKSEFLATVSHEIRTPLNGVIGMSEMLRGRPLDTTSRRYAEIIHDSADKLLVLINDILDFSRIEAGRLELEQVDFSLQELLDSAVRLFEPRAIYKNITLTARLAEDVPERLQGDPGRLRQVLLNLLSNAIKFTEQGEVSVLVAYSSLQERLHVSVSDSGPGIPSSHQHRLFEPFSQGDASTARRFGGSGLGLVICRRLVSAMDGEMDFVSRIGEGSCFWFKVPLSPANEPESMGKQGSQEILPALPSGLRLLVVEDNEINQQVAHIMLSRLGCQVDIASSGEEALNMTQAEPYALIFMDVQMPLMDGLEVTRQLRKRHDWCAEVPIVAMTAGTFGDERSRCLEAGMNDYLVKPLASAQLLEKLHLYIGLPADHATQRAGVEGIGGLPLDAAADAVEANADDPQWLALAVLKELLDHIEALGIRQLVDAYRRQLPERRKALSAAVRDGQAEQVMQVAHLMKGEALSLGLMQVGERARELETAAKTSQREKLPALQLALEHSLAPSLAAVDAWLDGSDRRQQSAS
ncbi:Signal transduction histidine kinase [Onishia taeanensis]|uniref:histidine kinase n=1 Tax=Onishia taeanensis TaxID=284577 RepID=A0A1G7MSZ8_9GAMM|nr:ATP-binding protein [Halomonas taeanensis]SDF64837.1 Signal transduction histidine kinase [Halomonas taeanensis]